MLCKSLISLSLAATAVLANKKPGLHYDPNTISSCAYWFDNDDGTPCETVRRRWEVSPETFHEWNPSVTVDCKNWNYWSYCVAIPDVTTSSTTRPKPSATAMAPPPRHPADSWIDRGCYLIWDKMPLDKYNSAVSSSNLNHSSCQNACWADSFRFAGFRASTECWCSNSIVGRSTDGDPDCNLRCSGNSMEFCGGKDKFDMFEGSYTLRPLSQTTSIPTSTSKPPSYTSESSTSPSKSPTSTSTTSTSSGSDRYTNKTDILTFATALVTLLSLRAW
ncbi:hypothetical protein VHEMI04307 [[Torrubiella] hemipterigena]|uniref:WSC domain-containing protein n=1 Tax=[Torrubiella] hemipterigena TaxID=1531966 RepID=A0A0A1SUX8_9HYPO|nr:hypothetical protein VHEMI04307 [[Torrubiella] hemipterigena]